MDFRERNGVELPDNPDVKLSSIERTLQFWLSAQSAAVRLQRYKQVASLLVSGKLAMAVKGYRTYNLIYQDMTTEPEWYDSQDGSLYGVLFSVKFLEPQPEV